MFIRVELDGDAWIAQDEEQPMPEGIAGCGNTPKEALLDFARQLD